MQCNDSWIFALRGASQSWPTAPVSVGPTGMGRISVGERFAPVVVANNGVVDHDAEAEAAGGTVMARGTNIVLFDAGARERVVERGSWLY